MTLKTDTEIICLPLPEIFSRCFTYLLAVADGQFLVSVSDMLLKKLVFVIFQPNSYLFRWMSFYCSAIVSRL